MRQVGTDRILELVFSDGQFHLFLEFYAGGNIVLTDQDLKVIALQRNVNEGAPHEHLRVGVPYNLSNRQNVNGVPPMSRERIKQSLQTYTDRQASGQQSTNKKLKKKPGDALRKALGGSINEYPPMLIDHALRATGFDITLQPEQVLGDETLISGIFDAMDEARKIIDKITNTDTATGYIFAKPTIKADNISRDEQMNNHQASVIYDDFHPFKPKHLAEDPSIRTLDFEGFNRTVDEFFSSIEGQKLESRLAEKEAAARRKLESAKQDQEKRIGGLQQVQKLNVRKAQAIEANLERVEETTAAVTGLIAQGMDWDEVEKLVELEQRRNNPVAEIIRLPLRLSENTVTLKLAEWDFQDDDDSGYDSTDSEPLESEPDDDEPSKSRSKDNESDKRLAIDIDLSISAWSNAREYYDQKRTAASKKEKTLLASAKALKSTQRKVEADLKKALKQEKQVLRPVRKAFWFEKFIHFLSSDGYLVLGARDAQQSDILYQKHLKKGDVWVHADLEGALPCVIKNRASPNDPIPPSTLSQAGNLSVATSSAWESKAVMSAWWATNDEVTKRASTGDYLRPGNFEVKGEKKYLPPAQLLLGFGVLFQISEESKARHMKHRIQDEVTPSKDADGFGVQVDEGIQTTRPTANTEAENSPDDDVQVSQESSNIIDERQSDSEDSSEDDNADEEAAASHSNPLQTTSSTRNEDSSKLDELDDTNPNDEIHKNEAEVDEQSVMEDDEQGQGREEPENDLDERVQYSESQSHNAPDLAQKTKGPIPVRGKRGKRKKIAQKYADQDEEDRAEAMRLLGSSTGQQKEKEDARAKAAQSQEAEAQRQRRREQHQRALERRAKQDEASVEEEEEEDINNDVDLDTLVGQPLPGDEILEALPICAPWGALGRYKYKAKLQPGSEKKGKAVRSILGKWAADAAQKRNVDDKAEDVERVWPKEIELIKSWKEAEVFGVVPVGKVRVMMSGASSTGGAGKGAGKQKQKQKKPTGKGSKKQR